jgi:parallel beta-helix repeat protein
MHRQRIYLKTSLLCALLIPSSFAVAQRVSPTQPTSRITEVADDRITIVRPHNRHPLAQAENEIGPAPLDQQMRQMILVLQSDAPQQTSLDSLVAAQHDPRSPQYHKWLTPDEFGRQFGASEYDLAQVQNWLRAQGFQIDDIPISRRSVIFSGTVAQVEQAFHTDIHSYQVGGELHYANATDPSIPKALSGVVHGVVALHNFRSKPMHRVTAKSLAARTLFTAGNSHFMSPGDFATIYNISPLYQRFIDGSGQSIAIAGRSNIELSDIRMFRNAFGLPAHDPLVILNGTDPGVLNQDELAEAELDVEWAGAVAKNADVKLVISGSTASTDGVDLSAQYIVDHNIAPVMSTSFGLCEADMGASESQFWNSLWEQAAAEGITVLVASGDSGAAGCESGSSDWAPSGQAVNGICSSPFSVCVGGTEFDDSASPGLYWSSATNSVTQSSALRYIPEVAWNDSGTVLYGSGLWSGGGGRSSIYARPSWQVGPGVPNDNWRYVPDVSLNASEHDGYLLYLKGTSYVAGGTSASSPAFAGIMALVVQQTQSRQGNVNTILYPMANRQATGGPAAFHDITSGDNSVPGVSGYTAGKGYDAVSGLGSVDADALVKNWGSTASAARSLDVILSAPAMSVRRGQNATLVVSVNAMGVNSPVRISISGLPTGVYAVLSRTVVSAPGASTVNLTIAASSAAAPSTRTATIKAISGSLQKTQVLTIAVQDPPTVSLIGSTTATTLAPGANATLGLNVVSSGTFDSPVTLSVAGLPAGMTASFSTTSIAAPGSGSSTLQVAVGPNAVAGTYGLVISAEGAGIKQSIPYSVQVKVPPDFTIAPSLPAIGMSRNSSSFLTLEASIEGGFNSPISLTVSGLPAGISAVFSPSAIPLRGNLASVLNVSTTWGATVGTSSITITASGGGISRTLKIPLTVAGGTDDTATIQNLLSNSGASGGKVAVPQGTYLIKSPLVIANNNTSLICQPGATFRKGAIFTMFIVRGNNVTIDGCAIDGTGFQDREHGIAVYGASNVQITNNKVTNNATYGIYLNNVSGARIQGNTISGNWGFGIFGESNTKNVSVLSNVVDNIKGGEDAIGFHSTGPGQIVSNIRIQSNSITSGVLFCVEIGGFGGLSPTGIMVTGNSCKAGASGIFGGYSFDTVTQPTISNNSFDSNGLTRSSVGAFEIVNCTNSVITGNRTTGGGGLSLNGSSNSTVYGNTFQNCNGDCMYVGTSRAVAMDGNRISNNVLSEGTPHGQSRLIFMQCNNYSASCSNTQITNNTIIGTQAGETAVWVERDAGAMSGTLVSGNVFKNTSNCVLFGAGTAPNFASKNSGCSNLYIGDGVRGSVIQP